MRDVELTFILNGLTIKKAFKHTAYVYIMRQRNAVLPFCSNCLNCLAQKLVKARYAMWAVPFGTRNA